MANKKITQLASKSSVLSTDLFPIGDASTGTLYKKTIAELQAAIGGAVISVNGKVGTVVLNTDDVAEATSPTNLYFTNTRARNAISLTTTGSSGASTYTASTGVLNIPTYTLSGLGGISTSFLSGGTGISYNSGTGVISYTGTVYTDSSVRGLFSANAPLSYNSTTGAFTISQATTSTNGYLSSTDWNTFNGKQNALTNPVTGTGTSGYVTKWTGTSTHGNSVLYDTGTNIGLGTTTPDTYTNIGTGIGLTILAATTDTSAHLNLIGNGTGFGGISLGNGTIRRAGLFALDGSALAIYTNSTNTGTSLTERLRITSAGNVGIGTTSPSYPLHTYSTTAARNLIEGTTNFAVHQVNNTGGSLFMGIDDSAGANFTGSAYGRFIYSTGAYPLVLVTNNTERMRITSAGSIGIGTSSVSPATNQTLVENYGANYATYRVNAAGTVKADFTANSISNWLFIGTTTNHPFILGTYDSIRMTITAGGNILMGTSTDNGERLYVSGAIRATGTITANSDITLKKNLSKIENALEKVEQINGYTYEFKADDSKRHAGVIAQEIEGVLPEIVNKGNDGLLGVEYGNISALLIEAIKEQQKKIQDLELKLNSLGL